MFKGSIKSFDKGAKDASNVFPILEAKSTKSKFSVSRPAMEIIFGVEKVAAFVKAQLAYDKAAKDSPSDKKKAEEARDLHALYINVVNAIDGVENDITDADGRVLKVENSAGYYVHADVEGRGSKLGAYKSNSAEFSHASLWKEVKMFCAGNENAVEVDLEDKDAVDEYATSYNNPFKVTKFAVDSETEDGEETTFFFLSTSLSRVKSAKGGGNSTTTDAGSDDEDENEIDENIL